MQITVLLFLVHDNYQNGSQIRYRTDNASPGVHTSLPSCGHRSTTNTSRLTIAPLAPSIL